MVKIKLMGELGVTLKNNELKVTISCLVNDIDPQLLALVNKEVTIEINDDQASLAEFVEE